MSREELSRKIEMIRAELAKAYDAVKRIDGDVGTLIRSAWWLDRKAQMEAWQAML